MMNKKVHEVFQEHDTRRQLWPLSSAVPGFTWRDWEKPWKASVRI